MAVGGRVDVDVYTRSDVVATVYIYIYIYGAVHAHWCVIVQLDDEDKVVGSAGNAVACRLDPIHLLRLGDATQLY